MYVCYQNKYIKLLSTVINGLILGAMASIEPSEDNLQSMLEINQEVFAQPNFYKMVFCYCVTTWVFKVHSDTNTRQILQIAHHMNKN